MANITATATGGQLWNRRNYSSYVGVPGWHLPPATFYVTTNLEFQLSGNWVQVRVNSGHLENYGFKNQGRPQWYLKALWISLNKFTVGLGPGGWSIPGGLTTVVNEQNLVMDYIGGSWRNLHAYLDYGGNGWQNLCSTSVFNNNVGQTLTVWLAGMVYYRDDTPTNGLTLSATPVTLNGNVPFNTLVDYYPGKIYDGSADWRSCNAKNGYFKKYLSNGTLRDCKNQTDNASESKVFIYSNNGCNKIAPKIGHE